MAAPQSRLATFAAQFPSGELANTVIRREQCQALSEMGMATDTSCQHTDLRKPRTLALARVELVAQRLHFRNQFCAEPPPKVRLYLPPQRNLRRLFFARVAADLRICCLRVPTAVFRPSRRVM
jgi:hypothetical protein